MFVLKNINLKKNFGIDIPVILCKKVSTYCLHLNKGFLKGVKKNKGYYFPYFLLGRGIVEAGELNKYFKLSLFTVKREDVRSEEILFRYLRLFCFPSLHDILSVYYFNYKVSTIVLKKYCLDLNARSVGLKDFSFFDMHFMHISEFIYQCRYDEAAFYLIILCFSFCKLILQKKTLCFNDCNNLVFFINLYLEKKQCQ